MTAKSEYYDAMITVLELIWGQGFMAPGGEGNVEKLVEGLDVQGKRVLDIGCGLGGPAFVFAQRFGANVVGIDLEELLIERALKRADELDCRTQTEFIAVEPRPLAFPDDSFDFVMSSGAFTQVDRK